jgi:tetratricopeptide (TPR) repeat protein
VQTRSLLTLLLLLTLRASAADTVIFSSPKEPGARLQKTGTILEFTGKALTLKSLTGREETLPFERVLEVQTDWPSGLKVGEQRLAERKLEAAITALREAKRQESRAWVLRRIMAKLVACYAESGRFDLAGEEFVGIAGSDPDTPYFEVIPLAWRTRQPESALETRAKTWLKNDSSSVAKLLGASWLLPTGERAAAINTLQKLTSSAPPRIALLAETQLWRTKIVTAREADIANWKQQLDRLSWESRATAWYILGDGLSRLQHHEDAALAYLHPPLEYGACRWMAADALLAAGKELQAAERPRDAARLFREIVAEHAGQSAATEASARLSQLARGTDTK